MARRNAVEVVVGAGVLLVAAGFLAYAVAHSGRSASGGYPLTAQFDHIDGLSVGADVRLAGVRVGSVTNTAINPESYLAIVTLSVQDGLHLPKDSSAEIDSDSLLGGKYVSLSPGGEQLLGKFIFSVTDMVNAVKSSTSTTPAAPPAPAPAQK
jgi:phospholipid/cholesterol/gamma-HCH transport system substrate-binding protein